jgi:acyl-CoA thioesterase
LPGFYDNTVESEEAYFARVLEGANRLDPFATANHIRITKVAKYYAEGELEITAQSLNPHGIVHGGCLATLADSVTGTAVYSGGRSCVTLSCNINYLAPATGNKIKCVSTPQKLGRTICIFDCTLTNDRGEQVASGTFTFFLVDEKRYAGLAFQAE